MIRLISVSLALLTLISVGACNSQSENKTDEDVVSQASAVARMPLEEYATLRMPLETIDGDTLTLADLDGKAYLLVNTASKCGYTPQYEGLQELYEQYRDSGLVVVGFPANNFGGQEPGSNEQILEFCRTNFNVSFPMMAKISVKGRDKHPLYVRLTETMSQPGEIKWNFEKFLLNSDGELAARFGSAITPQSDTLISAVEQLL